MRYRKLISVLPLLFTTTFAFCQSEALKPVVNSLAFYKQKNELKYLANAKKSMDSLITNHKDSLNLEKSVYRAVVNATILYADSLNTLKQPANFFTQTTDHIEYVSEKKQVRRYRAEMDYVYQCVANVYIRKGFNYMGVSDFVNAEQAFINAQKYVPSYKPLNFYIAYSDTKLGKLQDAAKRYNALINADSTKAEYFETASDLYKSIGDTDKALEIIIKGRKIFPSDKLLLVNEANIYNNKNDYKLLEPLLGELLRAYPESGDVAFVAANCYDHLNVFDKAETWYLHTIEINSTAHDPVFNLGLLYFKQSLVVGGNQGKYTLLAQSSLEKASEISPNDVKGLQVLGLVYAKTQNKNQLNNVNNKLKQLNN